MQDVDGDLLPPIGFLIKLLIGSWLTFNVVFSISEMFGYIVALIGELFLSVASILIHKTSPFGVKTTLFLATFVEYYEHTHSNYKSTSRN